MIHRFLVPTNYSLRSVLLSHGWSGLPPFEVLSDHHKIRFAISNSKKPAVIELSQLNKELHLSVNRRLSQDEIYTIRKMFGIDLVLDPFFEFAKVHQRSWIEENRMGRMLRGQTVFEDLIKLILTTNCSWAFTKKMVGELCVRLGEKIDNIYCFPTAQAMAKKNEAYYRNVIRAGYRSPHLVTIAKQVARGKLDLESWNNSQLSYQDLRKEILLVPGAGPYVAENLLRLLGRHEGLGVDSWVKGRLQALWNMKKQPNDKTILKKYKSYGAYKGLILWCDVTRSWHT